MALEPTIFKLTRPAQAHGEEITQLSFRPILASDIAACGYPFKVLNMQTIIAAGDDAGIEPDVEFHPAAVIALAARMAGVPHSTIANLPAGELLKLNWVILALFMAGTQPQLSNGASTSPGSGSNIPPASSISTSIS